MILLKESYGTLEYDSTVPSVTATFNGFMNSAQFRSFLTKGLDHMIANKKANEPILWLADTRKHVIQPDQDTKWVTDEWNPRALKADIRHIAFVVPENVFGEASVKRYTENTEKKEKGAIIVQMFESIDSAKRWFKDLDKE